ncbi:MAG: hypothetical protein QXI37_02160 [Thermoprotei archaeon]
MNASAQPLCLVGLELNVESRRFTGRCTVVAETENMVKVDSGKRLLSLPKREIALILNETRFNGSSFVGKPWKRIKRRYR